MPLGISRLHPGHRYTLFAWYGWMKRVSTSSQKSLVIAKMVTSVFEARTSAVRLGEYLYVYWDDSRGIRLGRTNVINDVGVASPMKRFRSDIAPFECAAADAVKGQRAPSERTPGDAYGR